MEIIDLIKKYTGIIDIHRDFLNRCKHTMSDDYKSEINAEIEVLKIVIDDLGDVLKSV